VVFILQVRVWKTSRINMTVSLYFNYYNDAYLVSLNAGSWKISVV
jgi:hypothetical protein